MALSASSAPAVFPALNVFQERQVQRFATIAVVTLGVFAAAAVWAASDIGLVVDGRPVRTEPPPQIIAGKAYLPLRAAAEALGAEVEWKPKPGLASVCLHDRCAVVRPSAPDGPTLIEGRLLVPLRQFSQHLGAKVAWDSAGRRVLITRPAPPSRTRALRPG